MTHDPISLSRRGFLRTAALGTAAVLFPEDVLAAEASSVPLGEMPRLAKVPLLGLGTGMKGGMRSNALWRSGEKNFRDTVRRPALRIGLSQTRTTERRS